MSVQITKKHTVILRMPEQSPQSCLHMLKEKVHIMCLVMSNLSINNFVIANIIQQVTKAGVKGTTAWI